MTIEHHPDISNLMCCAAGSQSEAQAAVIAAHVAICPECRKELARMELVGAAMFEQISPETVERPAPVITMRADEARIPDERVPSQEITCEAGVPYPLRDALGTDLDSISWKWLAPGVKYFDLPLSKGAKGKLRLLKVAPGARLPEHGHEGPELTLLLHGGYRDELGEFRRGDVSDVDQDVAHQPVADAKEGCICLVAYEKKVKLRSLLARIIQPWTGM